jgi:hypothetical protein
MPAAATPLERELRYFESHKDELLRHHEGTFVLISDEKLLGAFTSEEQAYRAGLQQLGNRPFLIRRVTQEEEFVQLPALAVGILHGTDPQ